MVLRERYIFDEVHLNIQMNSMPRVFAATKDRRTFYVRLGKNEGVRFKVHFEEDSVYYTESLHNETMFRLSADDEVKVKKILRRCADELVLTELIPMEEIGFTQDGDIYSLPGGWYSCSEFALPLPAPWWAQDAQVYDILEGIFMRFPDGSTRLARRLEYYTLTNEKHLTLLTRQGDCLVLRPDGGVVLDNAEKVPEGFSHLDRHFVGGSDVFVVVDFCGARAVVCTGLVSLAHPEHEPVLIEVKAGEQVIVRLAPGRTNPFTGNVD